MSIQYNFTTSKIIYTKKQINFQWLVSEMWKKLNFPSKCVRNKNISSTQTKPFKIKDHRQFVFQLDTVHKLMGLRRDLRFWGNAGFWRKLKRANDKEIIFLWPHLWTNSWKIIEKVKTNFSIAITTFDLSIHRKRKETVELGLKWFHCRHY